MTQSLDNLLLDDDTQKLDLHVHVHRCRKLLGLVRGFIHK